MAECIDKIREKWKGLHPLIRALMLVGLLVAGALFPTSVFFPSTPQVGEIQTLYMWNVQHTVNDLTAYVLNETDDTSGYSSVSASASGNVIVYWSIDIIIRHSDGTEDTVAGKVAQVYRSTSNTGSGIQSATYTPSFPTIQFGDALKIVVYMRMGTGSWQAKATFVTRKISNLASSTWTVYYYTSRSYISKFGITYGYFYWGDTTHHSRIGNVDITFASGTPPQYSNNGKTSTDISGQTATFYVYWNVTDRFSYLDAWKFYWRNESELWAEADSGSFPANTYEAWSNVTITLPAGGYNVEWYFWANTTSGLTNQTATQSFWCWKPLPNVQKRILGECVGGTLKAIYYNGTASGGKAAIYIAYLNISDGTYRTAAYDINTGAWTKSYIIASGITQDSHWKPSISVLPNGSLIVMAGYTSPWGYWISKNNATTESNLTKLITEWNSKVDVAHGDYPKAFRWSDRLIVVGRIRRFNPCQWCYWVWNETNGNFSDPILLINYTISSKYGMLTVSQEDNYLLASFVERNTGYSIVYFFYSNDRGETWYNITGSQLTLPIDTSEEWKSICVLNQTATGQETFNSRAFLDENNYVCILVTVRNFTSITKNTYPRVLQYTSTLNSTGTWTYHFALDENGNKIIPEWRGAGQIIAFRDAYYGRPTFWVGNNGRVCKYVRVYGSNNTFRCVWNDTDSFTTNMGSAIIEYSPEAYEIISEERNYYALSNLQTGTTQQNQGADEAYGVKLVANETGRLIGASILVNLTTQVAPYWRAALYNSTLHLIDESSEGHNDYGGSCINTAWWLVSVAFDNAYITQGETYWLVFQLRFTQNKYFYTEDNTKYHHNFLRFVHTYPYPFPDQITSPTYFNRTVCIRSFTGKIVVRGVGRSFPTELNVGWNSFYAWSEDVGHSLADVNASLHVDSINFTVITFEYPNGTQISLYWLQATDEYWVEDETKTVENTFTVIWIYCKEAGEWNHIYGS